jgi:hypothetical protein
MTVCPGASLYDRFGNLIHTYAPTSSNPVEEQDKTTLSEYKGGYYVDQAIEAATAYDEVVLGDGNYEVDDTILVAGIAFDITEANITLKSLNGADYTTIDATGSDCSVIFTTGSQSVRAANITIDGLTLNGKITNTNQHGIYLWDSGFTVQNCKFTNIPNDNIVVDSSYVTAITSGTITNNTFTGIGPGSVAYRNGILAEAGLGGGTHNISGVTVSNNTVTGFNGYRSCGIGVANSGHGNSTVTVTGNSVTNCYWGLHYYGAVTGMTDTYATTENTFSQCVTGVAIEPHSTDANSAFNLVNNTITNNNLYGIYILSGATSMSGAKDIRYNDISGNGSFGILNAATSTTTNPVAKYNWWGDATGPGAGTGTYASTTAQGSGDAVSVYVDYEPWLHKTRAEVVADNASYQAANMKLVVGWNTLSTPVKLILTADSIDELIPSGMEIGYYYDEGWHQITSDSDYTLSPCDAVYVKMDAITYVLLKFDAGAFSNPSKDLDAGWNLISLAYLSSSGMNADNAVASVYQTAAGLPGYSQVVSPSLNDAQTDLYGTSGASWTYSSGQTLGDSPTEVMRPGLGYWCYMQNAATLAGFTITPIVPDLD